MTSSSTCPKCQSIYAYQQQTLWICPECSFEWSAVDQDDAKESIETKNTFQDAFGNILKDGDSVSVIKDLKIKGSSSTVKVGTKVKNIHLRESDDGHNIVCKIDGFGTINLKSEFVKKV